MAFFDIDKEIYRIHVIVWVRRQLGGFGEENCVLIENVIKKINFGLDDL